MSSTVTDAFVLEISGAGEAITLEPVGVIEVLEGRGFQADVAAAKFKGNIHFEEYW